jgi:hypothetical protein
MILENSPRGSGKFDGFVAHTPASLCRRMQNDPALSTSPGTWPAGWQEIVSIAGCLVLGCGLSTDPSTCIISGCERLSMIGFYGLDVADAYVQQPALRTTGLRIHNGCGFSSLSNSRKAFAGQSSRRETSSTTSIILLMPFPLAR